MTRAQEIRGDIEVKCGSPRRARDILVAAAAECTDPEVATGCSLMLSGRAFGCVTPAAGLEVAHELDRLRPALERPGPRIMGMLASGVAKVLAGDGGMDQIRAAIGLEPSDELDRDRRRQVWMVMADAVPPRDRHRPGDAAAGDAGTA